MKRANTTKGSKPPADKIDWSAFDAMTPVQRTAAAVADADAQPLDFKRLKRVPRVKTLRRALKLSQQEFADRYEIPLGTVRDWEQSRKEPDTAAKVLLRAIAAGPEIVHELLQNRRREQMTYHLSELQKLQNYHVGTTTGSMVVNFPIRPLAKSQTS